MAVTAYTGRPGAGKSYALVEQVIVPAVAAGRRVLTNVEGVQPDKVVAHCILEGCDPDKVGQVVILAQSAPSCDFGQVGERFGNVAFGIDDGNHRRGQFAPS